jgi:hypothetical protein
MAHAIAHLKANEANVESDYSVVVDGDRRSSFHIGPESSSAAVNENPHAMHVTRPPVLLRTKAQYNFLGGFTPRFPSSP